MSLTFVSEVVDQRGEVLGTTFGGSIAVNSGAILAG